jgi:hypothetical protein
MFEAEQDLKEWRADALRLAEALRLIVNRCGDDSAPLHVIAVLGTQISVGDIVRGALAQHEDLCKRLPE